MDYIHEAYKRYIKKYKSRPNLFFIGDKILQELFYKRIIPHPSFQPSIDNCSYSVLGCVIIKVPNRSYGYSFYEYDDLFRNKDNLLNGRILVIEKFPLEDIGLIGDYNIAPLKTPIKCDVETLEIPLEILDQFKIEIANGLQEERVNDLNSYFCDRFYF